MLLFGIIQGGGMELHELHVLHLALGTVHHGYAVASGYLGVGGRGIYGTRTAGCHHGNLGQIGVHLVGFGVQYVCSEAFHIGCAPCHTHAYVVLGDDLHGKVVFQYRYVLVLAHGLHQSALYFKACIVGMMQDTEFRVSALSVQVKLSVFLLVEVHTPLYQVLDSSRSSLHHLLHGSWVGNVVTGYHGVLNVLVKVVHQQVCHRGYAALCLRGVRLLKRCFTHKGHLALAALAHFQCVAHACHAPSDNEKIKFLNHFVTSFLFGRESSVRLYFVLVCAEFSILNLHKDIKITSYTQARARDFGFINAVLPYYHACLLCKLIKLRTFAVV